jgi:hypothetical protein
MDGILKNFMESGRKLVDDTKQRRPVEGKQAKGPTKPLGTPAESCPHKIFIRRVIEEKPKRIEVVALMKKFIERAEEAL